MPKYLSSQQMRQKLLDHLYGLATLREIAELHHCSHQRVFQKLEDMIASVGLHRSTRDANLISHMLHQSDFRNRLFVDTPAAFYHTERKLSCHSDY